MPPACVTHTASHTHTPRTFADSPTMEPPSGVNENIPLSARAGSCRSMRPVSAGMSNSVSRSATAKSSGVKGVSACDPSCACGVTIGSWR